MRQLVHTHTLTLEQFALSPNLSAFNNLEAHRRLLGLPSRRISHQLLAMTQLAHTGKQKVSHFSPFMKLRLALALALMGEPERLVMNQPGPELTATEQQELLTFLHELTLTHGITLVVKDAPSPASLPTFTPEVMYA